MKNFAVGLIAAVSLLWPLLTTAQIEVTFPVSRAVLQRNNGNNATVRIVGAYTAHVNRIEARVVARDGQGATTNWTTIQNDPQGGAFAGDLTVQGGWYNLEVRGMNGDQQVGHQTIERVGVGEVFIVAGQSNAQGVRKDVPPSTDDRVNCVNFYDPSQSQHDPPFFIPAFQHLDAAVDIAPRGNGAWNWGLLGDILARRLNVPILFFNSAWGGTAVRNWRESASGNTAVSVYPFGGNYPDGQPYANLRLAFQYYSNMLGVRAVLWHQGEADNFTNTPADQYYNDLRYLIERSRQHIGKNVAWVVARASYDDMRGSSGNVLSGQNQTIANVGNVYEGPNTDVIQIPRKTEVDDIHFGNGGLVQVAAAWNNSLNDAFFGNAQPLPPAPAPSLLVSCAGNNLRITVTGNNIASVNWNTGENGSTIVKGPGVYQAKVRDGLGNVTFSSIIRVAGAPAISASGRTTLCQGESIVLSANYGNNITWNNGFNGQSLTVNTAGTYQVRYRDVSGCEFTSEPVNVTVNPLPPAPSVVAERSTTFCQGENTILTASPAFSYNWSSGARSQSIDVRTPGTYSLTITDQNGCTSPRSAAINVVVNPLPATPVITASGSTTFCADQNVTLTAPEENAYVWNSGQTTRSITVNQSGDFSIRTRNVFNCLSLPSNTVNVKVNPLPPTPVLSASGRTTFCDGDRVTLTSNSPLKAFWTTRDSTQSIVVTSTGNYSARVRDENGCYSPMAQAIAVDVKALPSVPVISQIGTYTLDATGTLPGTYYQWLRNTDTLAVQTEVIKANQSGTYTTRAFIVYSPDLTCFSGPSAPFSFIAVTENQGLSIYPNPSPDRQVILETLENLTDAVVTVYTLSGQVVFTSTVSMFDERKRLDLTGVYPGSYIIQVRSAGFNVAKRVMLGI